MDSLTVSEVLRLHLVSSGGRSSELRSKWRYQQRGGYSSADDPGVQLREEDPHILHMLATNTVYELPIGDKLKVIKCLCHQILTYASIRDVLEEKSSRVSIVLLPCPLLMGMSLFRTNNANVPIFLNLALANSARIACFTFQ